MLQPDPLHQRPDFDGILYQLFRTVEALSEVRDIGYGMPARAKDLRRIPNLEWVPAIMREWAWQVNSLQVAWRLKAEANTPTNIGGTIDIQPISGPRKTGIYGDWEGSIYFDRPHEPKANLHLRTFKIVDICAEEDRVGLFHDERSSPQLYHYIIANGTPQPLGVDILGYCQLLTHTLGFWYWLDIVRDLARPYSPRPYAPATLQNQQTVAAMEQYLPNFRLDAFVACYDQVRLPTPAA